jgi:hypothetical protein
MADAIETEPIPNPDLLFCRVHYTQYNRQENRITSAVFQKLNQSVDWSKYSTQEQTVARHKKPQEIKCVASITAQACRDLAQEVVHVPLGDDSPHGRNDAHSEIRGEKKKKIPSKLRDAVGVVWQNPDFVEPEL